MPHSSDDGPPSPSSPTYIKHWPSVGQEGDDIFTQISTGDPQSDDEQDQNGAHGPLSYGTRVQQLIYENNNIQFTIHETEPAGKVSIYIIKFEGQECRRRYSEFLTLRQALVNIHPTLIIPPLPEKHPMMAYVTKRIHTHDDSKIIEHRKRMLKFFLDRCCSIKQVREDGVLWRFLDANVSWSDALNSPPLSLIPSDVLKAPPLDVTNPTVGHIHLPKVPASVRHKLSKTKQDEKNAVQVLARIPKVNTELSEDSLDDSFGLLEQYAYELEELLNGPITTSQRNMLSHYHNYAAEIKALGASYNEFSLWLDKRQRKSLAGAISMVGKAADGIMLSTNRLESAVEHQYIEPMRAYAQYSGIVRAVLQYRYRKRVQLRYAQEQLVQLEEQLKKLDGSESNAQMIRDRLSSSVSNQEEDATEARVPPASAPATVNRHPVDEVVPTSGILAPTTSVLSRQFRTQLGKVSSTVRGFFDSDPHRNRRDQMSRTREGIKNSGMAVEAAKADVAAASVSVVEDLRRFQADKEADMRVYMIAWAEAQIEWATQCREQWVEARAAVSHV